MKLSILTGRFVSSSRHWSLVLLFLLFLAVTHASLSFIFGRIVKIDTHTAHQLETFQEVPVISDLSDQDVTRAQSLTPVFQVILLYFIPP